MRGGASALGPGAKSTAIIRRLPPGSGRLTKNSSRPFGFQAGLQPPSIDTGFRAPGPGYGRTYTSTRPESFDP